MAQWNRCLEVYPESKKTTKKKTRPPPKKKKTTQKRGRGKKERKKRKNNKSGHKGWSVEKSSIVLIYKDNRFGTSGLQGGAGLLLECSFIQGSNCFIQNTVDSLLQGWIPCHLQCVAAGETLQSTGTPEVGTCRQGIMAAMYFALVAWGPSVREPSAFGAWPAWTVTSRPIRCWSSHFTKARAEHLVVWALVYNRGEVPRWPCAVERTLKSQNWVIQNFVHIVGLVMLSYTGRVKHVDSLIPVSEPSLVATVCLESHQRTKPNTLWSKALWSRSWVSAPLRCTICTLARKPIWVVF